MGNKESRVRDQFLYNIVTNREGNVDLMLTQYPELVNVPLVQKQTNALCRAVNLNFMGIAAILLKHKGDINIRSSDGRTPLIWAAYKNNVKFIDFLIKFGAKLDCEDSDGWNALDIALISMNYEAAR